MADMEVAVGFGWETRMDTCLPLGNGLFDNLLYEIELFGDGIGLDSIDSLEIIAGIDQEFGVQMTGVAKENFYNIEALSKYVMEHMED